MKVQLQIRSLFLQKYTTYSQKTVSGSPSQIQVNVSKGGPTMIQFNELPQRNHLQAAVHVQIRTRRSAFTLQAQQQAGVMAIWDRKIKDEKSIR